MASETSGSSGADPQAATPPAGAPPDVGTFSSLRLRNYRLLWIGVIAHSGALWIEQVARPFLLYELTGSPAKVGALVAVRAIPQLVLGMFAGVITDWFDRRQVLLLSQLGAFILNVVFAVLLISGNLEIWHFYAAAAARGATSAFDQPARQSLVPAVVPASRITNAIALFSATQNTMRILGAAAAGFLIWAIGVEGAWIAIATIYAGTVLSTLALRVEANQRPGEAGARAMMVGLWEGWKYAWASSAIRGAVIVALIYFGFGLSFVQVFAVLFALDVLDIGALGQGIMLSLLGLGSLVGALYIASRSPRRLGLVLPLMLMGFGALLVAFSLSTYLPTEFGRAWLVVPMVLVFGAGLFQGIFPLVQALVLNKAPDELRGRLMGMLALDRATMAIGAMAAGLLAEQLGIRQAQIVYGAMLLLSGAALLAFAPTFRREVVGREPRPTSGTPPGAAGGGTLDPGAEVAQQGQAALAAPGREGRNPHLLR